MQVRGNDGQHTETASTLDQGDQEDVAGPGLGHNAQRLAQESWPILRIVRRSGRRRLPPEVAVHQSTDHRKQQRQHHKSPAPAQGVGQQAAHQLTANQAQRGAEPYFGKDFLTLLERHGVADPSHRQRNDGGGAQTHGNAGQHQRVQTACKHRQQTSQAATNRRVSDDAELAQAVAHRAIKQLRGAIKNGQHPDHPSGFREADVEDQRQLGQHGIANALNRHAAKSGK